MLCIRTGLSSGWKPPHLCAGGALQRSGRSFGSDLRFSAGGSERSAVRLSDSPVCLTTQFTRFFFSSTLTCLKEPLPIGYDSSVPARSLPDQTLVVEQTIATLWAGVQAVQTELKPFAAISWAGCFLKVAPPSGRCDGTFEKFHSRLTHKFLPTTRSATPMPVTPIRVRSESFLDEQEFLSKTSHSPAFGHNHCNVVCLFVRAVLTDLARDG